MRVAVPNRAELLVSGLVQQVLGHWLVPLALKAPGALSWQPVDALGSAARDVEHFGVPSSSNTSAPFSASRT
jgi:hypothetical protein